jgi:hypothetical protein
MIFIIILTIRTAIEVIEIIDKNLTIDKSIPKFNNISERKSTLVAK